MPVPIPDTYIAAMLTEAQRRGYRMSPEIIELVNAARQALARLAIVDNKPAERLTDALIPFEGIQYAEKPA